MKNCIALLSLAFALLASFQVQAQVYQQPTYSTPRYVPTQRYIQRPATPAPAQQKYYNINLTDEQKAKPSLGAAFYDTASGVAVRSVYTNSPAQKAGINSGDLITKVNGQPIASAGSLNAMIERSAAGSMLKLTKRNSVGKVADVECTVKTMGEVLESSLVPEASLYDQAVVQAQIQLKKMAKDIRNAEMELADLKKRYSKLQKDTNKLKAKAEEQRLEEKKAKSE